MYIGCHIYICSGAHELKQGTGSLVTVTEPETQPKVAYPTERRIMKYRISKFLKIQ